MLLHEYDTFIRYILILDVSKAYDTVLKMMLIEKLKTLTPANILNQFRMFIHTLVAKVDGYISNTIVQMRRGITQGGTSSPPLFRIFINHLPESLRTKIREKFHDSSLQDPALLVSDDVIALSVTLA